MPGPACRSTHFSTAWPTELGPAAIAIVLSGTGHDGSLGLKAIKLAGGVTMAQVSNGTAPEHSGMPESAIATGSVDLAVPLDAMPGHIMGFRRGAAPPELAEVPAQEIDQARLRICAVLLERAGHDFSQYKDKTFLRRVERRMQVLGESTLDGYIARITAERGEALMLFRDLLIGVTQFFRDSATFEAVESHVIPRLFEGRGASDTVRVWVPGCATGEEAYSLAMLLREHMDRLPACPKVQLFATDIDATAIGTARAGRYPATLLNGMAPARRAQFFTPAAGGYLVAKEIRDLCTFSPHSLVRDPPFSRMDLVSCRNLLIYMDSELQGLVIPCFHYSLVRGGILLLGSSETVVRHEALFSAIDKEHRIFLRREGPTPPLRPPSRQAMRELPTSSLAAREGDAVSEARIDWSRAMAQASSRVLERFAAPYAVVTAEGELLHYSSRVGNLLQAPLGPPSRSIFDMARRGLNLPLRAALRAVAAGGQPVESTVATENDAGETLHVTLTVEPLAGTGRGRPYLVIFRPEGHVSTLPASEARLYEPEAATLIARMEAEMHAAREDLQSLTEEHETALEELRSSNEELHSVNEELQSSNEELETSKEEIQSINEELQTVNAQLSGKIDELDRVNSDLRNLFESTRVATIFLDPHMLIRNFTPEVATIYNLIPSDRGRSLNDIVSTLDYDRLREDVRHVLNGQEPLELRVSRRDGSAHYLCRILPYRSPDSHVQGTLVTFVEVTSLVRAETQQRMLIDELNHRVKNMLAVVRSLAGQTAQDAKSLDAFRISFLGRLDALSTTYTLLSREHWTSIDLAELLAGETGAFRTADGANVTLLGPPLSLIPAAALVLGMAAHELVTNAVKYGAFARQDGRVAIGWSMEGGEFVMDWVESGGGPAAEPLRQGFGMTLIQRSVEHELEGSVRFDFLPGGLKSADLGAAGTPGAAAGDGGLSGDARLAGRRVLLVEDQFLIALDLERALQKAGCVVTGPVGRLQAALALATTEPIDFAVLDVNLAGEKVFPVAEILQGRGIPFLLTTGYGASTVPAERAHWRVMSKPYASDQVLAAIIDALGC